MPTFLLVAAMAAIAPAPRSTPPPPTVARALSGRVTDTTGSPLGQVRVTILEANRTTTTDLDGRYAIPAIPTGTYGVSFALVGYAPQVMRVVVRDTDVTLDATLEPTLIELPDLQVTATPLATTSLTSPQPVSVLSGADVQEHRAASLGETISELPGVHSFSTGSGIGKPVIRGLSSTRVLVLENGQRVESQQWGDQHGPQVEAAEASRIEVIRGPASVLYGSDAIGGVVNVITSPLPDAIGRTAFGRDPWSPPIARTMTSRTARSASRGRPADWAHAQALPAAQAATSRRPSGLCRTPAEIPSTRPVPPVTEPPGAP